MGADKEFEQRNKKFVNLMNKNKSLLKKSKDGLITYLIINMLLKFMQYCRCFFVKITKFKQIKENSDFNIDKWNYFVKRLVLDT